jgi:hypothetical protein
MVIDMMTEVEKECDERIRKAMVHSSKKRLSRRHVPLPVVSNWRVFLNSGDDSDSAWFHEVALPKQSFYELVQEIENDWNELPIIAHNGDRVIGKPRPADVKRRRLNCRDTVALMLRFIAYPDSRSSIGKEFGILENDATRYAYFGIFLFRRVLSQHPNSKINWPCHNEDYVERQCRRIRNDTPALANVYNIKPIGWIDGVRFVIHDKWLRPKEHKGDKSNEKKKTLRKLILITDSDGRVVAAGLNTPGSWHDSKAIRVTGLYDLIDSRVPDGYCILSDTAFRGSLLNSKVIKILKPGQNIPQGWTHEEYGDLEECIIHARQPSEQGNNTVVQAFPRIRQTLSIFDDTNSDLMEATLLVHNWRVATSDCNQVKKIFDELEKKAKEFGVAETTILLSLEISAPLRSRRHRRAHPTSLQRSMVPTSILRNHHKSSVLLYYPFYTLVNAV